LTTQENYYPIVDYSIYKNFICAPTYKLYNLSQNAINITSIYENVFSNDDSGIIHFVVKNAGKLVGSRSVIITNGNLSSFPNQPAYNSPISLQNLVDSDIEIGYYVEQDLSDFYSENLSNKLLSVITKISYNDSNDQDINVNQGVNIYHKSSKFGPMYRQWGQFFYNPEKVKDAVNTPYGDLIKQEVLFAQYNSDDIENLIQIGENINSEITENDSNDDFLAQLNYLQNQYEYLVGYNDSFLPATAKRESDYQDKWIGLHQENYATSNSAQVSTFSESLSSEYDSQPYNFQGVIETGAYSINKIFYSKGQNISGSGSYKGSGGSISK